MDRPRIDRLARALIERASGVTDADLEDDGLCAELFGEAIAALVRSGMTVAEIADTMRTSRPTIERWAGGMTLPHPGMRAPCLRFFRRTLRSRTVNALITALHAWSEEDPLFPGLVMEARALSTLLGYGNLLRTELAREFGIQEITVDYMANGVASPPPNLKRLILASLARRLAHQLDDVERIEKK